MSNLFIEDRKGEGIPFLNLLFFIAYVSTVFC